MLLQTFQILDDSLCRRDFDLLERGFPPFDILDRGSDREALHAVFDVLDGSIELRHPTLLTRTAPMAAAIKRPGP